MKGKIRMFLVLFFCMFFISLHLPFHTKLTPSEERGKLIYTQGIRSSGEPIKAKLLGASFNARILPCVNCHGTNGIGNPEGGVVPSPLDWSSLTKPYSIEFRNGRKRKSYDKASFKTALETGVDPSQNQLDPVMPFYYLEDNDVEDLVAYLKVIEDEDPNGVSDNQIDIGVIVFKDNENDIKGPVVIKTMKAYLDLINDSGGIFNRKINLIELYLSGNNVEDVKALKSYLKENKLFALVGSDVSRLSEESLEWIEHKNVPIIGGINPHPLYHWYVGNDFYYLFPGLPQKLEALYDFAEKKLDEDDNKIIVLHDDTIDSKTIGIMLQRNKRDIIQNLIVNIKDINHPVYLERIRDANHQTCIYLGSAENGENFFISARESKWFPNILTIGENINERWNHIPSLDQNNLFVAFSNWESQQKDFALENYEKMSSYYSLNSEFKMDQYKYLSSTILFTEILKMTGKKVTTQGFIERLHEEQKFITGFIPPLSFSANKRIGSDKIFIAAIDFENRKFKLSH